MAGFIKTSLQGFGAARENSSPFNHSFIKAFAGAGLVVILSLLWLYVRSDNTAEKLQHIVPVKTAMIEVPEIEQAGQDSPPVKLEEKKSIQSLPPAPLEGLYEDINGKHLPVIRENDGLTPFDAYKKPYQSQDGAPYICLVIVEYGLSQNASQALLDTLPPEVTFVLSAYTEDAGKWSASARAFGHEFWLTLPAETKDYGQSDTGPLTILKNAREQENLNRLQQLLGITTGYTGLLVLKDHDMDMAMSPLLSINKEIQMRGLGFVDSKSGYDDEGLAKDNLWLDDDLRPIAIEGMLKVAEQKAKRDGRAVVYTHPYPVILNQLKTWTGSLQDKGLQLAPLSYSLEP